MDRYLASHVYAAAREEDLLILDTRGGDYLCLPGVASAVTLAPGSNAARVADPEFAEALVDLGLTDPNERLRPRPPLPAPPVRDVRRGTPARPSPDQAMRMAGAGLDMLGGYWRRSFPNLIETARRQTWPQASSRCAAVAEAQAFHAMLPLVPFQGECLFRGIMLRAFLRRAGLGATWVIGCQTWPFEAHCWLQVDDTVLDDSADHVAGFTPILAL